MRWGAINNLLLYYCLKLCCTQLFGQLNRHGCRLALRLGEWEGGKGQNSCIYPQYCGCQNSCIYSQLSGCHPHQYLSAWEQITSFDLFNNCAQSPTELVLLLINQLKQMSLHLADVCFSLLHCPVLLCHTFKASVSMEWKNHWHGCQFPGAHEWEL